MYRLRIIVKKPKKNTNLTLGFQQDNFTTLFRSVSITYSRGGLGGLKLNLKLKISYKKNQIKNFPRYTRIF